MRTVLLLLPFLLLFVFNASAVELTGFGSAYYLYQKDRAPMEYYKKGDIHKYSKVGVNMTGLITKNASAHLQLVASGDDSDNDSAWQLKSDFAFISIAMASKYSLKIGRQAFPIWLFSGYRDIGVELPFSRQPAITTAVSSFKSFNGGSFVTDIYTGSDCKLALKVFAGEEKSNALTVATSVSSSQYGSTSIQFKNIYGVNANFEHDKVNLNMSLYTLDIYVATQSGPTPPGYQSAPLASMGVEKADIGSFGASYSGERLLAIFEHGYFRFKTANQGKLELHGGYGLLKKEAVVHIIHHYYTLLA